MSHQQELAKQRALIIMQVRSGQITATEGARQLGISRKTYYQWESRGLDGMLKALEDQDPGRPAPSVDREATPDRTYPGTGATVADGQSAGTVETIPAGIRAATADAGTGN